MLEKKQSFTSENSLEDIKPKSNAEVINASLLSFRVVKMASVILMKCKSGSPTKFLALSVERHGAYLYICVD